MVGGAVSAPRSIGLGCPLPALIVPCRTVQSIVCWTTEAAPKSTACVRRCRTAAEDQKDQNQDRRNRRAALATDPFPAQREAGHQCRETDREECDQTHDRVSGERCFGHRVTISGRVSAVTTFSRRVCVRCVRRAGDATATLLRRRRLSPRLDAPPPVPRSVRFSIRACPGAAAVIQSGLTSKYRRSACSTSALRLPADHSSARASSVAVSEAMIPARGTRA